MELKSIPTSKKCHGKQGWIVSRETDQKKNNQVLITTYHRYIRNIMIALSLHNPIEPKKIHVEILLQHQVRGNDDHPRTISRKTANKRIII